MAILILFCLQEKVPVAGYESHYLLERPADYSDTRSWPVLLDLRGEGEDAGRAIAAWRGAAKGYVLAAPEVSAERRRPRDEAFVRACLADLKTRLRVDPERVLLSGYSKGAELACEIAASHPGLFAGTALLLPREAQAGKSKAPPCYVLLGGADPERKKGREAASALANGGVDVMAREAPGLARERPRGEECRRALEWFEAKAAPKRGLDAANDFADQGRWLDATLVLVSLMDRPDLERYARIKLQVIEGAGIAALSSVEVAFANRRYADAALRCREAALQFSWVPVGEKIRRRLATLEADERVKRALAESD
jgi:predicted esterase